MTKYLNLGPNEVEGLYIYGSGELDQLSPLQETVKEGEEILESAIPRKIPIHFISPIESIRSIKCGQLFTLILSTSGNVYTFGCADNASLGHPDNPKASIVPLKFSVLGMDGGDCHGIAYDRENLAFWGQFRNINGPMGEPCIEPNYFDRSQINGEYIKKVISGANHVIILTEEKNVYTFGNNDFGQLGLNPEKILHYFQINKLLYEKNVEDIFTGDDHSFLVKFENGLRVLKSWGNNIYGQLGIGAYNRDGNGTTKIYIPTRVIFPGYPNISVKKVEGGAGTSICITEDNRIFVWGYNDFSILGLQDDKNKIIPNPKELVFFNPFSNPENEVNDILACHTYFYAKNNKKNKVYSWGSGDSFTLGNKKEKAEIKPYLINNLFFKNLYVDDLALGCYHVVVKLSKKKYEEKRPEYNLNEMEKIDIEKKEEIKPKKRKNDGLNEEKEENYKFKVDIKEEYITLNELDQPKFSKKYKSSKKFNELNENINKKAEDEINEVKNIENDSKSGKISVKKSKQTPSKMKKKQNSKSKEKNKKNDDDIEMRDDTVKNSVKKESKNTISLNKEKSEEKNKKNSASKNSKKRSTSKKEKEKEEEIKKNKEDKEEEDKNKEKKTNLRKIDLSNKKEKNSKRTSTDKKDKEKEKEKNDSNINEKKENKNKEKEKEKEKNNIKDKDKEKEKNDSNIKDKEKEKNKEKDDNNNKKKEKEKEKSKSKSKKRKSSVSKDKEEKKEKKEEEKEKEKEDKNEGKAKKSKTKINYPKDANINTDEKEKSKPKRNNSKDENINTDEKEKSKSKINYPKDANISTDEKDNKKNKKKNQSQRKKSNKKEKEEKEDENNENRMILRSHKNKIKELEKEKEKIKEKEKEKQKSRKSIKSNSKSKERYPKKKK